LIFFMKLTAIVYKTMILFEVFCSLYVNICVSKEAKAG
jgi:hypothetical protein